MTGVLEEAKFFGMTSLIEPLKQMVKERKTPGDYTPITRREFITMLQGCALNSELRCQVPTIAVVYVIFLSRGGRRRVFRVERVGGGGRGEWGVRTHSNGN